jgi:hypothetical protein
VCAPGAYHHVAPPFCLAVPAGFESAPRELPHDGITFEGVPASAGRSISIHWAKVSDRAAADALRAAPRAELETGVFEILETVRLPQGTFWRTHDATQYKDIDKLKIPTVEGVVVLETAEHVLRCVARLHLQQHADPRKLAQADMLDACKSLVGEGTSRVPMGTLRDQHFPVYAGTSCAGHGQPAPGGSLTRNGSTWSREESWAGGCPKGPVMSLIYEPRTSPLKVRICRDQAQDTCEAIRGGVITWELSTPLAEAGAGDVVLVP